MKSSFYLAPGSLGAFLLVIALTILPQTLAAHNAGGCAHRHISGSSVCSIGANCPNGTCIETKSSVTSYDCQCVTAPAPGDENVLANILFISPTTLTLFIVVALVIGLGVGFLISRRKKNKPTEEV